MAISFLTNLIIFLSAIYLKVSQFLTSYHVIYISVLGSLLSILYFPDQKIYLAMIIHSHSKKLYFSIQYYIFFIRNTSILKFFSLTRPAPNKNLLKNICGNFSSLFFIAASSLNETSAVALTEKKLSDLRPDNSIDTNFSENKVIIESPLMGGELPDFIKELVEGNTTQFEDFSNIVSYGGYINLNSFLVLTFGIQIFIFGIVGTAFNKNNFISLFLSMEVTLLGISFTFIGLSLTRSSSIFIGLPLIILAISAAESVVVLALIIFIYKSG